MRLLGFPQGEGLGAGGGAHSSHHSVGAIHESPVFALYGRAIRESPLQKLVHHFGSPVQGELAAIAA